MLRLTSEARRKRQFEDEALPYLPQIYNAARRLARGDAEAQDLVQDTYLRGYQFFDRYKPGTNLRAWLFKILTNLFINKYRRKTTEARVLFEGRDEPRSGIAAFAMLDASQDPEAHYLRGVFADEVQRALDALNDDFRMVVVLADLHDFAYKDIAEMLGCPVGTVMSRLFRGRRALQVSLLEYARARGIGLAGAAGASADAGVLARMSSDESQPPAHDTPEAAAATVVPLRVRSERRAPARKRAVA
jgi:RNA polymerase sigma-70 factor (ECF subfamily)